ncbi:MAG: valine--tRNA ligase [Candidatus Woesearchaeota archaeon]
MNKENFELGKTEKEIVEFWEKNKFFVFDKKSDKPVFSIDTPPPTISGKMHVGHAFSYSQGDMIARFQRMRGKNVFYPFGTDDNGLPTEKLVEKKHKVSANYMKRDEFISLCQKTIKDERESFVFDWKFMGVSADYSKPYSTIDENTIRISQKYFLNLHKKGFVYREKMPISWDTKFRTSVAQADFESVELSSLFVDIVFNCKGKDIVISTTRPELLPACVALFANPSDERYKDLKGKFASVPLFDYEVPILFDESVDKDKGTGLMMVCTFGDKEDIEKYKKHKLSLRAILNPDGKLNDLAGDFSGLSVVDARKKIIEVLEEKNIIIRKRSIKHAVNVYERSGKEIEYIVSPQWYIKVLPYKKEIIDAGNKIEWKPEFMKKRFVHWVENLNWDWCISRQRHFGVPFPLWYSKKTGEVILADEDELPIDPTKSFPKNLPKDHTAEDLVPEFDVMDTWATSAITPQIALDEFDDEFKQDNFPMDLRLQAHDIIRTWAFYTILKSYYHENMIPWENIMISGFVLDPKGNKMSKSKGNVVSPQEVAEKFGVDSFRFWAAGSKLGEDMPYMEKDVLTGKKTVNKIINASKFVFMNLEGFEPVVNSDMSIMDKWVFSKIMKVIKEASKTFEKFEYSKAKHEIDNFFWNIFCDYYLEFTKNRVYGDSLKDKQSAQHMLYHCLLMQLKLFAPIMPFVTEFVYQKYYSRFEKEKSIHLTMWPEYKPFLIDSESELAGDYAIKVTSFIRKYKSEKKVSLKTELDSVTITANSKEIGLIELVLEDIKAVNNIKSLDLEEADEFDVIIS